MGGWGRGQHQHRLALQDRAACRPGKPVGGVAKQAGNRAVVFGGNHDHQVSGGDARAEVGYGAGCAVGFGVAIAKRPLPRVGEHGYRVIESDVDDQSS